MKNYYSLFAACLAALFASGGCSFENAADWNGAENWEPSGNEKYEDYGENPFVAAAEEPVSTFSVDCDGASYTNMRRYVNLGQNPPSASVRIEEFINYFTFDYPEPADGHNVSVDTEVAPCPWNDGHLLMRIGLKGKTIPPGELPATNYVFLIDVSGSMNSPDKLELLKTGFLTLVDQLEATDRVAIVTYSGNVSVALPSTNCDEKGKIRTAIEKLSASGSTAGGRAIEMAYEIALENFVPDGNNRIILGTDGDFNVGVTSDEALVELIESKRDQGIYITVLGVGSGNLNDSMMEKIADKGNGTYEYIDNVSQIEKVFVNERSKFHTIAKDCKVQVTFESSTVAQYRLIGYENRALKEEDFDDDTKDAGDIGVGQTVTALYEIIPTDAAVVAAYANLDIRYKKPGNEESLLIETQVGHSITRPASGETRFAAGVAAFGMLLKGSEYAGSADRAMILELCGGIQFDPHGYRAEFSEIVGKAKL